MGRRRAAVALLGDREMKTLGARTGFSMVELVVAFAVTLVLMGGLVQANLASSKLTDASATRGRLEEAAARALSSMAGELRWAQSNTTLITADTGSSRVDFIVAQGWDGTATIWSTPVTFRYEPVAADTNENGVADEGIIVRLQDGQRRVLCRNVPLGGFTVQRVEDRLDLNVDVFGTTGAGELAQASAATSTAFVNGEGF